MDVNNIEPVVVAATLERPQPQVQQVQQIERVEPVDLQREQAEVDRNALQNAVESVNTTISNYQRHLSVRRHEATGRMIVKVYDSETQEMIREIPPESVLNAHAHILELAGLFVDARR